MAIYVGVDYALQMASYPQYSFTQLERSGISFDAGGVTVSVSRETASQHFPADAVAKLTIAAQVLWLAWAVWFLIPVGILWYAFAVEHSTWMTWALAVLGGVLVAIISQGPPMRHFLIIDLPAGVQQRFLIIDDYPTLFAAVRDFNNYRQVVNSQYP